MKKIILPSLILGVLMLGNIVTNTLKAAPTAGIYLFVNGITTGVGSAANGHINESLLKGYSEGQTIVVVYANGNTSPSMPSLSEFLLTKTFDRVSLRLKANLLSSAGLSSPLEIRFYDGVSNTPVYVVQIINPFITTSSFSSSIGCAGSNCNGIDETITVKGSAYKWTNYIPSQTSPQILDYNFLINAASGSNL